MILLLDHYDSFTYNLYQSLSMLGEEVTVARYDEISINEIRHMNPKAIVLSPGPGSPNDKLHSLAIIQEFHQTIPMLGVCLGHQLLGVAFGGTVKRATQVMHGKTSAIRHSHSGMFAYLPQPLSVMRYHSLVLEGLPPCFKTTAISMDDQSIMAIQHVEYPLYGLQFHPESIGTRDGEKILQAFLTDIAQPVEI
ncbi:aminodeoxychorismate/anthranilate synthase component II [Paenisporosarcina quisquiliarum]|uniref:Aminodeoxychorismate/anthranilate synthase component II n=1 Tax=Paenisporosarcina quisquiliarum TaxID=365346 RepID=A0A9X3LH13_9BACL|nr:aminodeoxychorismate/anthranilate synthase component II [Paenisporosarcina quisquiliarum]MCZ8537746.1 aminodeoxychorismate/anthranilate synthase component II [Paenisporosarcina quisquiliarum]